MKDKCMQESYGLCSITVAFVRYVELFCESQITKWWIGSSDQQDASSCRSLSAKEPLLEGLFCGKWPVKTRIRHPTGLRHCDLVVTTNRAAAWERKKQREKERKLYVTGLLIYGIMPIQKERHTGKGYKLCCGMFTNSVAVCRALLRNTHANQVSIAWASLSIMIFKSTGN